MDFWLYSIYPDSVIVYITVSFHVYGDLEA